jgi:hypothetical protein
MSELAVYQPMPLAEIERMADYVAKSGLFGAKNKDQAVALMMLAQAEGMHPMTAARDFDIIQGRPSKKAEAMLRDFHRAGGKVEWHQLTDTVADATFSHEIGGSFRCTWDIDRAKRAGLGGKEMWTKWPRQMLRSRCVSEGCKTVYPSATSGMYTPEEARDIEPMRDVTPDRPKRITSDPLQTSAAPAVADQAPAADQAAETAHPHVSAAAPKGKTIDLIVGKNTMQADSVGAWLDLLEDAITNNNIDDGLAIWDDNLVKLGEITVAASKRKNTEILDRIETMKGVIKSIMDSATAQVPA